MQSFTSKRARIVLASIIVASSVGCDQTTKHLAAARLSSTVPTSYLGGTVRLVYAQNPGGFLSLGGDLSPHMRFSLFTFGNCVFLAVLTFVVLRHWQMRSGLFVALLLLLAGGVSNLVDRIAHQGLVSDFLVLGIWPVQTGIINFADIAITAGGLMCVLLCRPIPFRT
jgi:signal peptidase II